MGILSQRRILLIISGGIAAYKSLDLIRRLKEEGAHIRCILTDGGAKFITPLSVSALTGEQVFTDLFSEEDEARLGHIDLPRQAELIVIAPASANMMAKMAHGLADSLASAVLLAASGPVLIAPAMNVNMWANPATKANVETLRQRGMLFVGPAEGALACGTSGTGRMSEVADILAAIKAHFEQHAPLAGLRALVTSGPTFEPIDPVRFIGNHSSGKQGYAIAAALRARGAEVTLVSGPTSLPDVPGVRMVHIQSAREMLAACQNNGSFDVTVCAAAVADWRPEQECSEKIKKCAGQDAPVIAMKENPDILATLARPSATRPRLVIGFAAETGNLVEKATEKFKRKGCDWLLANDVSASSVFGKDENEVIFFTKKPDGQIQNEPWPRMSKKELADRLAQKIEESLA